MTFFHHLVSDQTASYSQEEAVNEEGDKPEWQKYLEQNDESGRYTYTDPNDGTVYEWHEEKRAWFPKVSSYIMFLYIHLQCILDPWFTLGS